uniref:Craniofacial development protein 2-like n=1 Tax=Nicotiana tabacum TaxID=4097 RepID=A0A1S4CRT8_TOBAC|nr:PREDICTED: craniofacial development protein 2-like [Nicotiana tabacum]
MGKSIELANILQKRKVNIECVQETRWVEMKTRDADGYRLWYSGVRKGKNRVGILVDRDLRESVVEVRLVSDRLMTIKLVVGECTINIISAYAPQSGLDEEVKRRFWEELDEIVRGIPPAERLFIGRDFNGHIGSTADGYGEVHGGFGYGDKNGGGTSQLDFAKAFELVIANSSFSKREEHLVVPRSRRRLMKGPCFSLREREEAYTNAEKDLVLLREREGGWEWDGCEAEGLRERGGGAQTRKVGSDGHRERNQAVAKA